MLEKVEERYGKCEKDSKKISRREYFNFEIKIYILAQVSGTLDITKLEGREISVKLKI